MKTVLITGVSRGIGRALTERFLENGDCVIGTSTSGTADFTHARLTVLPLDLSKPDSIRACAERVAGLDAPIDILVNNAGIWGGDEETTDINQATFRRIMEVNVFGLIDFTERVLPFMADGGHVVNVSSRHGSMQTVQDPFFGDYKISKAAVNMYTRVLAARLKDRVTVSCVHPGWVKTDMGGAEADLEPAEAAAHLFVLANAKVKTGQFWFKGETFPW